MVGEIRDAETAAVAIQAALTGHLVLSTLHTNDSFSAVTRLADMGIEPFKISAALVGVIAQRLVRMVCPQCKTSYYPDAGQLAMIGYRGDTRRQFTHGEGCRECHDTGFRGRIGIYEVLTATRSLRRLISDGASADALRSAHQEGGGTLLMEEGIAMAELGKTSLDEVIRVAHVE
jgi:type II secretory ATPase GspE/PulE/Tfp pilus assembly ATPase PilB-like protein